MRLFPLIAGWMVALGACTSASDSAPLGQPSQDAQVTTTTADSAPVVVVDGGSEVPSIDADLSGLEPDSTYLRRANAGLAAWGIGLEEDRLAASRELGVGNQLRNPRHWITTAGFDCEANGVPSEMRGAGCALTEVTEAGQSQTIGVCQFRAFADGTIADSTSIMLEPYQDGPQSDSEKTSTFTHEVGHCLGLRHTDSEDNLMFFRSSGADQPSAVELSAIDAVYGQRPPVAPTPQVAADFYLVSNESQLPRYHAEFPVFHIDGYMGNRAAIPQARTSVQPGPVLGPLTTIEIRLRADGSSEIKTF